MRRHDYLRLRTEQSDVYPSISAWDTAPFSRLQAVGERLVHLLASEVNDLLGVSSRNTQRLYLRALRYLREHGMAPEWPLHQPTLHGVA